MNFKEFGKGNRQTIVLLHGGGLNWWNYKNQARLLENDFHVILPILDGHAGSDRPFTSIEANAAELIEFIDKNLGGSVLLIGGLSLGAQILLEMLSQRKDICRYAVVESAAVIPSPLANSLIGPSVGCSYFLVKRRWFSKMQFKALRMNPEFFEDYFHDTCGISKADMVAFLKANTSYFLKDSIRESSAEMHVFAGQRENREILKSVEAIHKELQSASVSILPHLYHGQFSTNNANEYVKTMRSIMNSKDEQINKTLIDFWDKALELSEEDRKQTVGPDDWKDLAPSEKLFDAAKTLGTCKKLLDYGCGSAWASIIAAKSGCDDVTAVDVAPGAAHAADFYAKLFGVKDKIKVSCVDPSWLKSVPAGIYDGFVCSNVLDVVPTETCKEIISNLARVIKPGSRAVIGLNFYLSPESAASKGIELENGNMRYVDGVLRLVSRTDEEWSALFSPFFTVEKLDHFAWPGEKTETRRLFYLRRKRDN